ncbi:FadR/GntR family transcriptional regulator [Herbiconiux solani]|uniref:FadR/GntR family transcriptional regulator n=1 Tax=Herbiconiux solani TaxID=661329 RepID=UPI0008243AB2|nr:FadR/GntR family transcriptional regulator [Herbiconiux solani]
MAVTDEAILRIKDMILSGELRPGDRLPPEKELSERLGLSRNSLREAVKALEVIRVLDVRRGDGTFVTSLEPRLLLEAMTFVVDLHDDDTVLDLFAVRRILEPAAARMAAAAMTRESVEALRATIPQTSPADLSGVSESDERGETDERGEPGGAADDTTGADTAATTTTAEDPMSVDALIAHDLEFHSTITAAAGNAYLSTVLDSLSGRTIRARIWRGLTQENAVARTLDEHRAIVDALAAGDGVLAEALSVAHISGVEKWLEQWRSST